MVWEYSTGYTFEIIHHINTIYSVEKLKVLGTVLEGNDVMYNIPNIIMR